MIDWGVLEIAAFRRALGAGLGRALLHVRHTERVPDLDALWAACVTCQTHDWVLEGHRAGWLWQVLGAGGLQQAWADRLLAALPEARATPDADQLAGLALCIARQGHPQAVVALRDLLQLTPDPALTVCGARELVTLQGVAGLRTVVHEVGTAMLAGDDRHREGLGTWMAEVEDLLSAATVRELLRAASTPAERAVRDAWFDEGTHADAGADPGPSLPAPLGRREHQSLWMQVQRCAEAMAGGAPLPMDALALARALARLGRRPPRQLDPLWLVLDGHPSARVRRQLSRLFTGVRDPLLRGLALEGPLGHPNRLRWMVANFEPGDSGRIQAALGLALDPDEEHDRCGILLRLHEARADENWVGCLVHVYGQGPSSLHREEAVIRLLDDGSAPPWLAAEASWDAHGDVAAAARMALAS